jgi:hypothetical protein
MVIYMKYQESYKYPSDVIINYNNTNQYRICLRGLFDMDSINYPDMNQYEDLDDVTRDELEYDENSTKIALDYIYSKTKNNSIFKELYLLAAAKMISTDRETGLIILLSYDYLVLFHPCLVTFLYNPTEFNENNIMIIELKNQLK